MKKMKTLKIGAFAILSLLAVACNDDDDKNTAKLTSEEQAEMVASSMGQSGFAGSAEQSGSYADNESGSGRVAAECGVENQDEVNLNLTVGGVSFTYNSDFTLKLTCDGDQPESFRVTFDYNGSYNGPRFESSYDGDADLTISRLNDEEDHLELNGSYDRDGNFKVKADGEVTEEGNHDLEIQAEDVMIDKSNHQITGGKAFVNASGRIDGRGNYSFSSEVTFSGSGASRKATIEVAGDTYELNIQSNTLVKVN